MGQYKNDRKNGKGKYSYKNGNKYIGDWVDDHRTGQGVFIWPNGDQYEMRCSKEFNHHSLSWLVDSELKWPLLMNNRRENIKKTSRAEKVHYAMLMEIDTRREVHKKLVKIHWVIQYRINTSDDNSWTTAGTIQERFEEWKRHMLLRRWNREGVQKRLDIIYSNIQ